ncbi:hypothetical protein [Streptomyces sp. NPDC101115]|uniref:hypothetical protein n=1 Tax=Streptomyces sp. NPDC101115 TaxID=3366106 RepID=UPI00381B472B
MPIPGNLLSAVTEMVDPNTSGWTAKLNATLSLGSGGRNGNGCLLVKSVAAGEAQARTVAAVPVTAGTEYAAFGDASGSTVPERIGIRWLDATSTEISITWSLVTASASASWHRIAVAGIAPAGATQAHVVLSMMTPGAANVSSFFENIYFGVPIRTTGNLLTYNTESVERDSSGWAVDSNCSISRTVPAIGWSVSHYLAGGHMLAMQVTANGNAAVRTVEQPTASPGTEYIGYAYLSPPTSGSSTWVELRFYDAAHALIGSAVRATLAAPGTGVYRQRVSAAAPAGTAYVSLAAGITGATAGQIVLVDNAVISAATPIREGSVVPYADASFEQGIAGWAVTSGVATLARLTPWGTDGLDGSYCMTVSSATATTSVLRSARFPIGAAAAGHEYTAEIGAKVTAGGWTLTRGIRWYDAANTDLGVTLGTPAAIPTPNWWLLSTNGPAPAGATQAAIEWTLTATSASSVLRLDSASLWQSLPLVETLTNDAGAYITVTMREFVPGDTVTLWRVTADGQRTLVRGTSGLISGEVLTSATLVVEDYEAPLGVPVYYYAEARNSSGVLTATRTSVTVTLDPGDPLLCWVKDPGNPQRNCRAMVAAPPDWTLPIQQAVYRVKGRPLPVVHSDVRGGHEGQLVVWTRTDSETAALRSVLASGNVLLLQFAPGKHESDRYVSVADTPLPRIIPDGDEEWRAWTLPLIEVDQPVTIGVASSAGRTWRDVLTEFDTWADVLAAFETWEDVRFNRRRDV